MLVYQKEENQFSYYYWNVVSPNDNSSLAVCISELIDKYLNEDMNHLKYSVDVDLILNNVLSYLDEVLSELSNTSIEFADDNNYVIKYRDFYCWITWSLKENKCEFKVIIGTKFSNTDLGIYVYGTEDDDKTEVTITSLVDVIRELAANQ